MQVKTEEDEENEAPYLYRCPICLSSGETGLVYDEGVDAEGEPESILRGLVPAVELQGGIVEWGLPCNHRTCLPCATRWMREKEIKQRSLVQFAEQQIRCRLTQQTSCRER